MAVKKEADEVEIDFLKIFGLLWKNVLVILLVASIFCAAALTYTVFMVTPKYEAVASMYVNNSSFSFGQTSFSISSSELSASNALAKAYIFILETRETIEEVIKEAGLNYTYEEIMNRKMISTQEITGTAIFKVKVTSTSPTEAELIANTIVKVLPTRIEEIIDGSSVRTVSFAIVPAHRASPSYTKASVLSFVFGAVCSCLWIIVRDFRDRKYNAVITGADDLSRRYPDLMILSVIPDMSLKSKNNYYSSYYGSERKRGKKNENKQ
ncbi:MAG: Wzz/FepE/Etk N-terminal domain-containing protein [Eubacteriales bacterium]|nr:Wzz/FepE/Etk N-terminal domain-containing protein [Eubacteriales bacterium]